MASNVLWLDGAISWLPPAPGFRAHPCDALAWSPILLTSPGRSSSWCTRLDPADELALASECGAPRTGRWCWCWRQCQFPHDGNGPAGSAPTRRDVAIEPTGGSYTATRLCVLAAAANSTIVARETLTVRSRFWLPSSPRSMNMKPFAFIALCQVCQVNSRVAMGGPCCWSAADELQDSEIATYEDLFAPSPTADAAGLNADRAPVGAGP